MKRLQNRISENANTLFFAALWTIIVWLIATPFDSGMWLSVICLFTSTYLIIEMTNANALLRVRSRMVCGLSSFRGAFFMLCISAAIPLILSTYQNNQASGRIYYAFICIGISSIVYPHVLFLIPLIWFILAVNIQSLSLRTWTASVLGTATPYWLLLLWFIYKRDITPLADHFSFLSSDIGYLDYTPVTAEQVSVFLFLFVLSSIGIIHFWINSYQDKIQIRQIYGAFIILNMCVLTAIALVPPLYDSMIRIAFLCSSPIIAHFLTLSSTRLTNILFFVIIAVCVIITAANIWMLLSTF